MAHILDIYSESTPNSDIDWRMLIETFGDSLEKLEEYC